MKSSSAGLVQILLWMTVAAAVPGFGQWRGTSGPSGGDIRDIAIHPRNSNIVYAVVSQPYSGVLKSTDGGIFWEAWTQGLEFDAIENHTRLPNRLTLDEMQPETLFVVINESVYYETGALYRSNNGGANWAAVNELQVYDLCARGGLVFGLDESGLLFSADAGDSWVVRNDKIRGEQILWDEQGILWIAGTQGLFRSADSGRTYQLFTFDSLWRVQSFDVATVQQQKIIAVGVLGNGRGHDRLYVSYDEGVTWLDRSATLPHEPSLDRYSVPWAIKISPHHPNHFYAGLTEGFFRTTDGGEQWVQQNNGLALPHFLLLHVNTIVSSLAISAQQPDLIIAGTFNDGIFRSTDEGMTWRFASAPSGRLASLSATEKTGEIFAASNSGIYSFEGNTWTPTTMLIGEIVGSVAGVAVSPHNPQLVFCLINDSFGWQHAYKSIDAGKTWQPVATDLGGQFVFDPFDANLVYTTSGKVSRDQGDSWQHLPIPTDVPFPSDLAVHPANNEILYLLRRNGSVDRSFDQGETWTQIRAGIDSIQTIIRIDHGNPNIIYIGGLRLYKSEDAGQSWILLPFDKDISGLALDRKNQEVFIGTPKEGVWRSSDAGNTFTKMEGLPSDRIVALLFVVQNQRKKLFAGTQGVGVYEYDLGPALAVEEKEFEIVKAFSLQQNYPNPFNPETKIVFFVPPTAQQQRVVIKIFDLTGRLVRVLFDRQVAPGRYEVMWDGRDARNNELASGTYVYRLEAGGRVIAKKMALLR